MLNNKMVKNDNWLISQVIFWSSKEPGYGGLLQRRRNNQGEGIQIPAMLQVTFLRFGCGAQGDREESE